MNFAWLLVIFCRVSVQLSPAQPVTAIPVYRCTRWLFLSNWKTSLHLAVSSNRLYLDPVTHLPLLCLIWYVLEINDRPATFKNLFLIKSFLYEYQTLAICRRDGMQVGKFKRIKWNENFENCLNIVNIMPGLGLSNHLTFVLIYQKNFQKQHIGSWENAAKRATDLLDLVTSHGVF